MTVFEQIKSAIDIKTVAEGYGLHIDRAGMALCPFHDERTPSAKIYPDNFHCFGCGVHADMIGFTQKLFNLDKPIEAVKKLNEDFCLHIDIDNAPTPTEISEYQKRLTEKKAYQEWEQFARKTLHDYLWLMRDWRELASNTPDEKFDERFIYSLHHLDYAEYLCDEFIREDKQGRLSMKNIISEIAGFLKS